MPLIWTFRSTTSSPRESGQVAGTTSAILVFVTAVAGADSGAACPGTRSSRVVCPVAPAGRALKWSPWIVRVVTPEGPCCNVTPVTSGMSAGTFPTGGARFRVSDVCGNVANTVVVVCATPEGPTATWTTSTAPATTERETDVLPIPNCWYQAPYAVSLSLTYTVSPVAAKVTAMTGLVRAVVTRYRPEAWMPG